MEYCPHCRSVRNVRVSRVEERVDGARVVWETVHCLTCGTFIRSSRRGAVQPWGKTK